MLPGEVKCQDLRIEVRIVICKAPVAIVELLNHGQFLLYLSHHIPDCQKAL